jgi:DNA-binding PadR family transcriptional regulator
LERFGYITIEKTFVGRMPQTTYRLTPAGSEALASYIGQR